jgi:hypothetical protein
MKNEGLAAFWKGLPWAYFREGSYTAIRLGGKVFFLFLPV